MKLIIRLVVLIVVALFIFTGGFWLGNQWKGDPEGSPAGELITKLPGQEAAEPKPDAPETELPKAPDSLSNTEAPAPDQKDLKVPANQKDGSVPEQASPPEQETAKAAADSEAALPPETPAKPAPPVDTASKEESAPPEKPSPPSSNPAQPAPAGGEPLPEEKDKKDSLALIVTPEDLGSNQITYSVQAGTFLEKDLAQIRLEQLKAKQYPAFMTSAWDDKKQLWHTVRIGRFTDIMKAQMAAKEITMKERIPATVYGVGSLRYEQHQETVEPSQEKTAPLENNTAPKTQPAGKEGPA